MASSSIESSSVKGEGEVTIKDSFEGSAIKYNERMMGNGSISLDTQRSVDRKSSVDTFVEKKDLVFTGGNLKGHQTVGSRPTAFDGGMGASVTEQIQPDPCGQKRNLQRKQLQPYQQYSF